MATESTANPAYNLPIEVRDLITVLGSTDQIEVLLLFVRSPSEIFHGDEIGRVLGLSAAVGQAAADALHARRLVARTHVPPRSPAYQYAPATIALHAAAEELAVAWDTHSMSVVKLLYERSNLAIRAFADAFRLRRQDTL